MDSREFVLRMSGLRAAINRDTEYSAITLTVNKNLLVKLVSIVATIVLASICLRCRTAAGQDIPAGQSILYIRAPLGLPPFPIRADNPPTAARVALGHRLFFDPILSGNNKTSCANCHKPQFGFADDRPLTKGSSGAGSRRNVPTVVNSGYLTSLFWDGRTTTLEEQVRIPIESPEEMSNMLPE